MDGKLTFFGWFRPPGADLVASGTLVDGRLSTSVQLTVRDTADATDSNSRLISYDLFGPGDVRGFTRTAVVNTVPSAGARNVEIDKAVHAELAAADLPWRYTVERPQGQRLRPWIVLLVGTTDEIRVAGETAFVEPAVLDAHPLTASARFAHVELDGAGRTTARIMSARPLAPDRAHVAVVVPAFEAAGVPAYTTPAPGAIELPAYHHWAFHTKAGGDFVSFARRFRFTSVAPATGTADVEYGPLPQSGAMPVRGALVAITNPPAATSVSPAVEADLAQLTADQGSATNPIITLPDLTGSWPIDPVANPPGSGSSSGWRDSVRRDYRVRAVAGLGEHAGVLHQELLATEAGRLAGSYEEVSDRLRRLTLGLLTSRSLWTRRMPADTGQRLSVIGPALREVLTATGPVAAAMEHPDRSFERSLFSSAAQRALRTRTSPATAAASSSGHSGPRTLMGDPAKMLGLAAAAPPRPVRSRRAAVHTDVLAAATGKAALDDVFVQPAPKAARLKTEFTTVRRKLDAQFTAGRRGPITVPVGAGPRAPDVFDKDTATFIRNRLRTISDGLTAGRDIPILPLLELLDGDQPLSRERARDLAGRLDAASDSEDLANLAKRVSHRPADPTTMPLRLDRAIPTILDAFDPTTARPALVDRVLDGVFDHGGHLTADPGAPIEMVPDVQLAAWQFLRDDASDWLLPGADDIDEDAVVGLTTNASFVDAFLLGLNAQVVSELRFRNYPMVPGWTPVRTFWDRAKSGTVDSDDDIVPIDRWTEPSNFGDASHLTPSAGSADLVILFNSGLFREYPGTIVSLIPVARDASGAPDWVTGPDFEDRLFPAFQGRISADLTFFGFDLDPALGVERWLVLEETVKGRRFFNATTPTVVTANNGADYAAQTFSPARRVMIRGDVLLRGL